MAFYPGHSAILAFAEETLPYPTINEDGTVAAPDALPAGPFTMMGYSNIPQKTYNTNNGMGFGLTSAEALYRSRGRLQVETSFQLKIGSKEFIKNYCTRPNNENDLQPICIIIGINGVVSTALRFCKCNTASLNGSEQGAEGGGGELTVDCNFWGLAVQQGPVLSISAASMRQLETPLKWHDCRKFTIEKSNGALQNMRKSLMAWNATINHNLERKGWSTHWGDNNAYSRIPYDLMPHHIQVTGRIDLHEELDGSLFNDTATSQDWGDVVMNASNAGVQSVGETAKEFNIALLDAMPGQTEQASGEANTQIQHSVDFVARNLAITTEQD